MVKGTDFQGLLEIGQRVHCILYGGQDGIIYAIHGEQKPENIRHLGGGCVVMGGTAHIDVVFEDHISRGIPEGIVRGVQWRISDEKATQGEIEFALVQAEVATRKQKEDEKQAAEKREERREILKREYPHLEQVDPKKYDSLVKGSRNLKRELTAAFPGIVFSVRSESYSGGCSICVNWNDGPEGKEVERFAGKYEEGSFNGMEDIYEYDRENVWPDVFGGAKYVFCNRHETERPAAEPETETVRESMSPVLQKILFD